MSKKIVRYMVTFEVEDEGELDTFVMRDGLQDLVWAGLEDVPVYKKLDDSTTKINLIRVEHISTSEA